MNKEEFKKRFESLSDLKVIRFNQIRIHSDIYLSVLVLSIFIFGSFSYLFFHLRSLALGIFFAFLEYVMILMVLFIETSFKRIKNNFLIKYGKNN